MKTHEFYSKYYFTYELLTKNSSVSALNGLLAGLIVIGGRLS